MAKDKKGIGGRPPKNDPTVHTITFKLNSAEKMLFGQMMQRAGITDKSKYIKSLLFGREVKVVRIDKATMDYYIRLTNFYHQFQAIGNNYNQTVRAIKSNFGEKRGLQMLYKLEKVTIELVVLSKKIIALTREYEEKWLRK
ncbi:MobA protein [Alistipes sp. OttesenSCG-928-L06]|nr:MobA protein [Alistipes sp. OttesenSCG-928-L06]